MGGFHVGQQRRLTVDGRGWMQGLVLGVAILLLSSVGAWASPPGPGASASTPPAVLAVAAGGSYSLVLGGDGVVYGTGDNGFGQLTGRKASRRTLTLVSGLPAGVEAAAVAAGQFHSLVLGDDGVVYGTGDNGFGQLTGTRNPKRTLTPLPGLPAGVEATAVSAGGFHSLVLGDDGVVYGTGDNWTGQLTGADDPKRALVPVTGLPAGVEATAVVAGWAHSLVVGDGGQVYGTGDNTFGQLTGTDEERRTLTLLSGLPAGVAATAVAAGGAHSLVLGGDGVVYGTGDNRTGQLTGTDEERRTLTLVAGLQAGVEATAVAAGWEHSLVVRDNGLVYGTGDNTFGQLTGTDEERRTLTLLSGLPAGVEATAVAARFMHSLVVADGLVYGTGSNELGQLTGAKDPKRALRTLAWGIANTVRPKITGKPRMGQRLTARHGRWWPTPTSYAYRWYRTGKAIRGATHKTYRVTARDRGTRLKVKVTAKHPGYHPARKASEPTARITRSLSREAAPRGS